MITWGISANSHNAALAVFDNDQLVFASESERFSKVKNDPNLNQELLDYALEFGTPSNIVWYEKPWLKTLRQYYAGQGKQNNNVKEYLNRYNINLPIKTVTHHHSHAAAGYYTSNFDNACVVVIDAIGEFETITIWQGKGTNLKKLYSRAYPHSIGLWYSAMTQRIGLKPNEEEYILMGMAAYGDPNRLGSQIANDFIKDFRRFRFKENLHRGCKDWAPELGPEANFDIAAGVQYVYEKLFDNILNYARLLSGSKNLVLMGGCALNCSANPIAYKYFENVWIMPAPGDSGSAIGAVLADRKQHIEWPGVYLGYDMGYCTTNEEIVDHLIKHQMCGLARGRAEFGPRALGNRSLIADPRDKKIKVAINQIKHREQFRPFAPAILEEFADQYFFMPTKSTPYMQFIAGFKEYESFPAIVHHDNTSRVQTVNKTDNPQFRALLELWYDRTGCPMLLNTSLNVKGQPMVNDHADLKNWEQQYGLPVFN
jgi:carbamoyltransferase